jgi:hypothetical protein
MPSFAQHIGIDYSGAKTPTASLKGLRVYLARVDVELAEVHPPPSPRIYWTRRGIAEWLVEWLSEDMPTLVGIDHGFSFPLSYFEAHGLAHRCLSPALRSAIIRCTSTAKFTASTTLPNSISVPSPMSLTTRPWCSAVLGSISSLRIALRDVSVTAPAILLLNKGGFLKILERGDGEHRR